MTRARHRRRFMKRGPVGATPPGHRLDDRCVVALEAHDAAPEVGVGDGFDVESDQGRVLGICPCRAVTPRVGVETPSMRSS